MGDMISRQAAIYAIKEWGLLDGLSEGQAIEILADEEKVPSAQPEKQHGRIFQGIIVEYPTISTYSECKGKPYFSIKYTENGQEFIGYGTYKPEVLSEYLKEFFMPSAQPEHTETHSCDCERTGTHDLVSRRAALEAMDTWDKFGRNPDGKLVRYDDDKHYVPYVRYEDMVYAVKNLPSAQRWIPFKTRPLTDEEKEEYPYYDDMLDCQLPENGQRILVNVKWNGHEFVQMDEYYNDDGSYLDSGYEIGSEATAWMPLPEQYKESEE